MPPGILPNEGIGDQLGYILRADIPGVLPWELLLWVNDLEPDADTVYADLTEASFYGYHRVSLDRDVWTVPSVNDGCATSYAGDVPITWTVESTEPQTIYGVAYLDQSAGVLRYVQRFDDEDIQVTEPGLKLRLLPQYTLTSAACGGLTVARRSRAAERRKGMRR